MRQIVKNSKKRSKKKQKILAAQPDCIYCGHAAQTIDHCPPKSFFKEKHWPEGYEFSCCSVCNNEARPYEQIMGVLIKVRIDREYSPNSISEWEHQLKGLINNQKSIIDEWNNRSISGEKRFFRETFGSAGDKLRHTGYGTFNMGRETYRAINYCMVKLTKALYFMHMSKIFNGVAYIDHIPFQSLKNNPNILDPIMSLTRDKATTKRNRVLLGDQFDYTYLCLPDEEAFCAIVQFSEQFVFVITALNKTKASDYDLMRKNLNYNSLYEDRFDCSLKK